jgi:hypothetical protein
MAKMAMEHPRAVTASRRRPGKVGAHLTEANVASSKTKTQTYEQIRKHWQIEDW